MSKPGSPASVVVGMSGNCGKSGGAGYAQSTQRSGLDLRNHHWRVWVNMRSLAASTAGYRFAPALVRKCWMAIPVLRWNNSVARWSELPVPGEEKNTFPVRAWRR